MLNRQAKEKEDMNQIPEQPSGDVKERDNIYVVELEVGNFSREEIKASFNDGYLIVTAERPAVPAENLQKAFFVGKGVAQENIRAALHNGVLKCMIPKDEKKQVQGPTDVEIM